MTSHKPFPAAVSIHDRGHAVAHNNIAGWLNQGGLILSAPGLPTSAQGEIGDFYLDTTSPPFVLYGPKTITGWPAATTLAAVILSADALATTRTAVAAAPDLASLKAAIGNFLSTLTAG